MTVNRWERFDRKRNDDPYHAWMLHRRLSEQRLSEGGPGAGPLCPVIIKVHPTGEETLDGLAKSLQILNELVRPDVEGPKSVLASAYDIAHLNRSLEWTDGKTDELTPKFAYMQYYLVYVAEDELFVHPGGQIPTGHDQQELPKEDQPTIFEIIYAGAGISDIIMDDLELETGILHGKPQTAITVIDDSFAFLNEAFIDRRKKTKSWRFDEIWFQDVVAFQQGDFRNGARLQPEAVAKGIKNPDGLSDFDLYRQSYPAPVYGGITREFVPLNLSSDQHQPLGFAESHGTHVAARALQVFDQYKSGDLDLSLTGVALPVEVTENTSGSTLGSYVLAGIRQAMMWNDQFYVDDAVSCSGEGDAGTPLVINFSYGFLAGMKDGTSKLNRAIAAMINARNGFVECRPTALVVPMGNSYDTRSVARKCLTSADTTFSLDWIVLPDDRTSSFVEIYAYSEGDASLRFELVTPTDKIENLCVHTKDRHSSYQTYVLKRDIDGTEGAEQFTHAAEWSEWAPEPGSAWTRRVFLALGPTETHDRYVGHVPPGRWTLKITNLSGEDIRILAMVQRDDTPGSYPLRGKQSFFDHPNAWEEGAADFESTEFPNSGHFTRLTDPLTYMSTGSSFAAIDSSHIFVVGAGTGPGGDGVNPVTGDDQLPAAFDASLYAAEGPRRFSASTGKTDGPDYSGLADRSLTHPGIFAAGTNSATEVALGGSSVAAPELTGLCAARPQIIVQGRDYLKKAGGKNPGDIRKPDGRFGLVKQAIEPL